MASAHRKKRWSFKELLETLLVAIAGFVGGFVSTLASNGSAVTLPALQLFGLPDHIANGTNRLSVIALGLVGTISFHRQGLIDWRKGGWIAALIALGTIVGSLIAIEFSEAVLDTIVTTGLLLVLGLLLVKPGRWLEGKEGTLRPLGWGQVVAYFAIGIYAGLVVLGSGFFILATLILLTGCDLRQGNAMKAFILLVVGMQNLLIFDEAHEVSWAAGIPLALGSASGAYVAARLATKDWAKVWVYRFLVLLVVLAIVHLIVIVDPEKFLQHA
jgi:uncharacterized membrane protein YfcA